MHTYVRTCVHAGTPSIRGPRIRGSTRVITYLLTYVLTYLGTPSIRGPRIRGSTRVLPSRTPRPSRRTAGRSTSTHFVVHTCICTYVRTCQVRTARLLPTTYCLTQTYVRTYVHAYIHTYMRTCQVRTARLLSTLRQEAPRAKGGGFQADCPMAAAVGARCPHRRPLALVRFGRRHVRLLPWRAPRPPRACGRGAKVQGPSCRRRLLRR